MSWKTIGQRIESTTQPLKHKALQELDEVNALIDWESIGVKLSDIHTSKQGLLLKEGTVSIIDTSVIQAKQCRPNKNKAGETAQDHLWIQTTL